MFEALERETVGLKPLVADQALEWAISGWQIIDATESFAEKFILLA